MLMELGFHNYEVLSRMMPAEKQRAEASNLLCSITVLDRQWSATTGLPANFDAKSFDTSFKTNVGLFLFASLPSFTVTWTFLMFVLLSS